MIEQASIMIEMPLTMRPFSFSSSEAGASYRTMKAQKIGVMKGKIVYKNAMKLKYRTWQLDFSPNRSDS
jgi:hypothetical protein